MKPTRDASLTKFFESYQLSFVGDASRVGFVSNNEIYQQPRGRVALSTG